MLRFNRVKVFTFYLRRLAKRLVNIAAEFLARVVGGNSRTGRIFSERLDERRRNMFVQVRHGGVKMDFNSFSPLTAYRAATFSSKEPDTLKWIDTFATEDVFWDVGANVGLYSIYAALKNPGLRVVACEPSVFNLQDLALNIERNNLSDSIVIVPAALSERTGSNVLNMSTIVTGGALSSFGESYGHDGKALDVTFRYKTVGISLDDAINVFNLPAPNHIKIDVDGIEHLVLRGSRKTLSSSGTKSVLVEVNEDYEVASRRIDDLLLEAGFSLLDKNVMGASIISEATQNKIYVKPNYLHPRNDDQRRTALAGQSKGRL